MGREVGREVVVAVRGPPVLVQLLEQLPSIPSSSPLHDVILLRCIGTAFALHLLLLIGFAHADKFLLNQTVLIISDSQKLRDVREASAVFPERMLRLAFNSIHRISLSIPRLIR